MLCCVNVKHFFIFPVSTFDAEPESGWSFLVFTQPRTSHQLREFRLRVNVHVGIGCEVFDIVSHLGIMLIFLPIIAPVIVQHSYFPNATRNAYILFYCVSKHMFTRM